MAYELIETVEVGAGGASSIQFTSIPQDGVDLVIKMSIRSGDNNSVLKLVFNDSSSNLSDITLLGTGSSVVSFTGTEIRLASNPSSATANTFSNGSAYIPNYSSSASKSVSLDSVYENNNTSAHQRLTAGLWDDSSPITKVALVAFGTFAEYSTASLYKIS